MSLLSNEDSHVMTKHCSSRAFIHILHQDEKALDKTYQHQPRAFHKGVIATTRLLVLVQRKYGRGRGAASKMSQRQPMRQTSHCRANANKLHQRHLYLWREDL